MVTKKTDSKLGRSNRSTRTRAPRTNRREEEREFTEQDRLNMFRNTFFQSALPDLPPIEGYHVCWLTTTNPRDPIHGRMRLGYTPVKPEDIPGWEMTTIKTGEYEGCIGVNEMVAFKLPLHLYEMYMREAHHNQPRLEEEKLKSSLYNVEDEIKNINSKADVNVTMMEGNQEIDAYDPEPPESFEETLTRRERNSG